jgi:acyl-coenzyme A synthetase/AMP-(fatty) acid ligase
MSTREVIALRDYLGGDLSSRFISDIETTLPLNEVARGTLFDGHAGELAGRSVMVAVSGQLMAGLAMIELDGLVRRMLLCPPDLNRDHVQSLIADAQIDVIVTDEPAQWQDFGQEFGVAVITATLSLTPDTSTRSTLSTDWLMLTSGTTGAPKIVGHSLAALTGAILADGSAHGKMPVWATFYDIRRYGGLQIFLRAIVGGGSMVLSHKNEAVADHLIRLRTRGVTHLSGTPSHWRKVLMSGAVKTFAPAYVRLSGEIADQAVLDSLAAAFPNASIGHAYASTEAGVGFAVNDGKEGFPESFINDPNTGVQMKVVDGSLRIRSTRTAHAYIGRDPQVLMDADGFIDTGDMVELRDGRYYFVGRRGGIINVGGLKVHPEEVEGVINRHRNVRMSRVRSRKSPITGSIVIADVVLADAAASTSAVRDEILAACRSALPFHKVPAMLSFVAALDVSPSGKLVRGNA